MMLGEYLKSRGFDAVPFNCAEGLLEQDISSFAAIVLDIQLPGMWGSECAFKVRETGFDGLLLAITGYMEKWDEDDLSDLGFDEVFSKPFEPESIAKILSEKLC